MTGPQPCPKNCGAVVWPGMWHWHDCALVKRERARRDAEMPEQREERKA